MTFRSAFVSVSLAVAGLAACSGGGGAPPAGPAPISPTAAATATAPTGNETSTPAPTASPLPSATPARGTTVPPTSPTATPAPGPPTPTPTPAATLAPGATPTPTPKPTQSPTPAATPSAGASPNITVHSGTQGAVVSRLILGTNMAAWVDITESGLASALSSAGYTATRWPGGSESDEYHWQTNTSCNGGYTDTNSTFDNFMNDVAKPANLDVAITLNYGSNAACNAGGDPSEAAAWVAHAKSAGDDVKYWTVGNEEYGSYEYDLHASKNDPSTYASALSTGYYPAIKNADANALVGAVVEGASSWDTPILATGKYDFVELHEYFTGPGQENDQTLLTQGPSTITSEIAQLKGELASAGHASTPIYLGEIGSVYSNPGKQEMSIVQGLYAGMVLGELMNDGVFRGTWWLGFGGCDDSSSGANFSSSIYGWQNFGGYMSLSDGTPEYGCNNATTTTRGTLFPVARAYQLMSQVAHDGEHALGVTTASSLSNVRSYAATHGSGYAVVLFNLDENDAASANVAVDGLASGSSAAITTYGKLQYDNSQQNVWTGPVSSSSGAWTRSVPVTLPAWSMTVVVLSP